MKVSQLRQIIKEEISRALNEDKLVLNKYARELYSFFKNEVRGATPTITTGEGSALPNVGGFNVIIAVTRGGDLEVGMIADKSTVEYYLGENGVVPEKYPDLEPVDKIVFKPMADGRSYGAQTFMLKTTKKGGYVGNTQTNK